jgi:hypothetical protein
MDNPDRQDSAPAPEDGDRVGVNEAARRLDLSPSTVSRQLEQLGIARDTAGKFSLAAYGEARDASLNPLMARNKAGARSAPVIESGGSAASARERRSPDPGLRRAEAASAAQAGLPPAPEGTEEPPPEISGRTPLQTAAAVEKTYAARLRQLEYEQKAGVLCERRTATEAGERVGAALQDMLRDRRVRLAETVAGLAKPEDIVKVLEREDLQLLRALDELARNLLQVVTEETEGDVEAA